LVTAISAACAGCEDDTATAKIIGAIQRSNRFRAMIKMEFLLSYDSVAVYR